MNIFKPAAQELEAIRKKNRGVLRAPDVVAFARDPETALHGHFEWDDRRGGELYRLQQARAIIRVNVTILPESPGTGTIRTYVSLLPDRKLNGGGYRALSDVLRDNQRREMLLGQAMAELAVFRKKYEHLNQLAPIFAAMDAVQGGSPKRKPSKPRRRARVS